MSIISFKYIIFNVIKRHASNKVRVRFAPSPTGQLHLGGLRTALYNHLFARARDGTTILRIEDTDRSRRVDSAVENLINDLSWCGIDFDEGPYFQSERIELYKKYAKQLVEQGDAYYCFCSKSRLDLLRKEALKRGEISKYDNACRNLSQNEIDSNLRQGIVPCIRFKLNSYEETMQDLIIGPHSIDLSTVEGDFIVLKSDGFPTYHLANVVDDHLMDISHVLRGVEWQLSTSKHLQIYKAFKWKAPEFGHFPLLLNPDGSKLSKRQNDLSIEFIRESGFLPNAVINFVVRYGGGFNIQQWEKDEKSFTISDLTKKFDISKIISTSSKISFDKLDVCNNLEIKRLLETERGTDELVMRFQSTMSKYFAEKNNQIKSKVEPNKIKVILNRMKNRINKMEDFFSKENLYFWMWDANIEIEKQDYFTVKNILSSIDDIEWELNSLKKFLANFAAKNNCNFSNVAKLLRKILYNNQQGPAIAEIMEILGKEEVESRLRSVITKNAEDNNLWTAK